MDKMPVTLHKYEQWTIRDSGVKPFEATGNVVLENNLKNKK